MTKEKNPAAVAIGKLGGSKKTDAQKKALDEGRKKGGWPKGRPRKITNPKETSHDQKTITSLETDAR